MGHAPQEVGHLYSKLKDDGAFRQETCERSVEIDFLFVNADSSAGDKSCAIAEGIGISGRYQRGRRRYLVGELYGLRSRLHRFGGKDSTAFKQPFWAESVKYVFRTFRKGSLRTVQRWDWGGRRDSTFRSMRGRTRWHSLVRYAPAVANKQFTF